MSIRDLGLVIASLGIGALIGNAMSGSYLNGRLSACKDITGVLNRSLPLELQCSIEKGDVYISTPLNPGVKASLDGSKTL